MDYDPRIVSIAKTIFEYYDFGLLISKLKGEGNIFHLFDSI
jgi:hypothetical protein